MTYMAIYTDNLAAFVKRISHAGGHVFLALIFAISMVLPYGTQVNAQINLNEMLESAVPEPAAFPVAGNREAPREMKINTTAYSSDVWQTDSTPFHTADGTYVRDGIVAANFLPLGTRVKFPELYGDKEFVVKDRMNARYYYKIDLWMPETSMARQYGLQYTTVEIY